MNEGTSSLTSDLKKRKVIQINHHGCGRMIKQSIALFNRGWDVSLLSNNIINGTGAFNRKIHYESPETLDTAIRLFPSSSIFVVHNEPSWMVSVAKNARPNSAVVFDVHDTNYWRTVEGDFKWYEDDIASVLCDAYVFPSESAKKKFPKERGKPSIVIPSANVRDLYYFGRWDYWGGLVSEGGHIDPRKHHEGEMWRDYTELYTVLSKYKKIFALSAEFKPEHQDLIDYYEAMGVKTASMPHGGVLKHVGKHDWGLVGNTSLVKVGKKTMFRNKAPVWEVALPNKFFDYLAGGVPIMNIGCPEVAKLNDEYGFGINVNSLEEMLDRWDEEKQCRANVFKHRDKFCMEKFIPRLERLFAKL